MLATLVYLIFLLSGRQDSFLLVEQIDIIHASECQGFVRKNI